MSEIVDRIENELEAPQAAVPMWVWGVTAFVAAYAVMLQRMA